MEIIAITFTITYGIIANKCLSSLGIWWTWLILPCSTFAVLCEPCRYGTKSLKKTLSLGNVSYKQTSRWWRKTKYIRRDSQHQSDIKNVIKMSRHQLIKRVMISKIAVLLNLYIALIYWQCYSNRFFYDTAHERYYSFMNWRYIKPNL